MTEARRSAAAREPDSETEGFYKDLQDAAREVGDFVGEQMRERPYATLGAAAAVGYAMGLPRGAVAMLAGLFSRMALARFETLFEEAPAARARQRRRPR